MVTPSIYVAIHVISGMIAYYFPILIILMVGYQLLQLVLNCRFFLFSWEIKKGNSAPYTFYKILQYIVGYAAVFSYESIMDMLPVRWESSEILARTM